MTSNNIKELRLSFLLSPREFARRVGIYPDYVSRLESGERSLSDLWIDAVARSFDVPREAVTASDITPYKPDSYKAVLAPEIAEPAVCPIAARFAIQSLLAKLAGLKTASKLSEDDLADAVQGLVSYVGPAPESGLIEGNAANRLSQGLQITVLTILQSCLSDPPEDFQERLRQTLPGALSLLVAFSRCEDGDGQGR